MKKVLRLILVVYVLASLAYISMGLVEQTSYENKENTQNTANEMHQKSAKILSGSLARETPQWLDDISITYPDEGAFASFLSLHEGKVIYLSSRVDLTQSNEKSQQILELVGYLDKPVDQGDSKDGIEQFYQDSSISLPLDGLKTGEFLKFELQNNNRILKPSYGGVGIVTFPVSGYFRVTVRYLSGPRRLFELKEIPTMICL